MGVAVAALIEPTGSHEQVEVEVERQMSVALVVTGEATVESRPIRKLTSHALQAHQGH